MTTLAWFMSDIPHTIQPSTRALSLAATVVGGDPNKLEITGTPRAVKSAYPLYPGIQDFC